ncbi:ribbon-helix-helix domain-containing protein [Myxosarcina sp. GI1]|uniref:ribbon-helix-helix domain-containing protein n=1 Tax=Myxosarcina sp. GI1 TaxID=1541065 RepID=UPI000559DE95|nr:ribbon-helix-helix domain-containing protein [Myxosarcina sp. GI1]
MTNNSSKQRISITVDSQLLEEIDRLTKNRSAAVEAGLRLWHKQQIEEQLRNFYQNRSQKDIEFEQEWARSTQEQAIAAWDEFSQKPSD